MSVSIIIPLFNRWDMTEACLAALAETAPDAEIITVDNGSTDATRLYDCTVRNPRNRGFAVACNQGARRASGTRLVFLNNDTEPQPGWLEPLRIGDIAGPLLTYADGSVQSAGITVDFSAEPGLEAVNRTGGLIAGPVDAVTGACLSISRTCWDACGGFDEGFYNGYEDVDLCLTARDKGYRVLFHPESVVIHHESQSDLTERFRAAPQNIARLRDKWS